MPFEKMAKLRFREFPCSSSGHTVPGLKLLTARGRGRRRDVGRDVTVEEESDQGAADTRRVSLAWLAASSPFSLTVDLGSLLLLSEENLHHKVFLQ